jgi:O-antigen ligase
MVKTFNHVLIFGMSMLGFCILLTFFFINPTPVILKSLLLYSGVILFFFIKQKVLIYISMFLVLFPVSLGPLGSTSNGIILMLAFILFVRIAFGQKSIVSFQRILSNPSFIPGLLILFSYLISWVMAFVSNHDGMDYHTKYFISILCAFIFFNIIIGFLDSRSRLLEIQHFLLFFLLINVVFAYILFVFPTIKLDIPFLGAFDTGTGIKGEGLTKAFRLGGITFSVEAFSEYVMMSVVFLTSIIALHDQLKVKQKFFITGLLITTVVALLLTNTRGAIFCSLIGVGFIIIFFTHFNPIKKTLMVFGVSIIFLTGGFIVTSLDSFHILERSKDLTSFVETDYGLLPKGRAGTWIPAIDQIIDDRFMGNGPAFFPLTGYEGAFGTIPWPHNILLIIIGTVGIYGLIAYLFLFIKFLISLRMIAKITDAYCRWFYKSLWVALLMFFIDAQKYDGALRQPSSYFYFMWMLFAIFFSYSNLTEQKTRYEMSQDK